MATTLQIRHDDVARDVTIRPGGEVTVGDAAYRVNAVSTGVYRVTSGDRSWTVAVAGPAEARWVFVDGRVAVVDASPEGASRRRRTGGGHGVLSAPMPATVVTLLVEPGTAVAKGDTLVVLEAMKMELPIRAPRDGVVARVHCRPGELVQPGVDLLDLE